MRYWIAWALAACSVYGQTGGGATLVGTIKDSSGSVVAGATMDGISAK